MISIHAPRVGRDANERMIYMKDRISIHAPRVGRDAYRTTSSRARKNFNPRAPCGARLCQIHDFLVFGIISIHAPRVGRDSVLSDDVLQHFRISIHAPRVGRDLRLSVGRLGVCNFNPRAPCGARRLKWADSDSRILFQSTRPVWGATAAATNLGIVLYISIHAPRVGRDFLLLLPGCN